jgi:hypothetical protein
MSAQLLIKFSSSFDLILPYIIEHLDLCNIFKVCYFLCKAKDKDFDQYVYDIYYPLYYHFGMKFHPMKEIVDKFAKELVFFTVKAIKDNHNIFSIESEIYTDMGNCRPQYIEFSTYAKKIRYELCKLIPLMPSKKEYYLYYDRDTNTNTTNSTNTTNDTEVRFKYPYNSPQDIDTLLNIKLEFDENLEIFTILNPLHYILLNLDPSLANRLLSDNIVLHKDEQPIAVCCFGIYNTNMYDIQYGLYDFIEELFRLNEKFKYSDSEFGHTFDKLMKKTIPLELIWEAFTQRRHIAKELSHWY